MSALKIDDAEMPSLDIFDSVEQYSHSVFSDSWKLVQLFAGDR